MLQIGSKFMSKKGIKRAKLKEIPKRKNDNRPGFLRSLQIGIRLNPDEYRKILKNAETYHNGSISDWVRLRAIESALEISLNMFEDAKNQKEISG